MVEGREDSDRYFAALKAEIDREPGWRQLDAVFFGGGTPSFTGAAPLRELLDALRRRFGLADGCEVSLEANPEDWNAELATELLASGFTRVSFGAQSWDPVVLRNLGRRHAPEDATRAIETARQEGFESVSVDLIFGEPSESSESWIHSLHSAIASGVDHVSTYALTVEPGTELYRSVGDGAAAPDDDVQADRYEMALDVLGDAGFVRYEVSNHARQGHACRYNLLVWARGEYSGFGMGAHAFRRKRRTRNARIMREYVNRVMGGESPVVGVDDLDAAEAAIERMFVGLRRVAGIPLDEAARRFLATDEGRQLAEAGVIGTAGDRLRVINPLLTDTVARALLG